MIHPFFLGANLVALGNKAGIVRPIAIGCMIRRLVVKIAGLWVMDDQTAGLWSA